MKFITPSSNSIFDCYSPNGIKLIARLRLGFSHLHEHKFRHNSQLLLIQFAVAGMTSKLLFITYFIVQTISKKGGHSWTTFKVLEKTFMIKMVSKSQNCFYLAFVYIMMHQIHVECIAFWMLPSNTYCLLIDLTSLWLTLESFERFTFLNTYLNTTVSNNSSRWW